MRVSSVLSGMSDSVSPWTVACQAPLSPGFSRQEYWSELPFPLQGILPTQEPNSHLLHWQVGSLHYHHLRGPDLLIRRFEWWVASLHVLSKNRDLYERKFKKHTHTQPLYLWNDSLTLRLLNISIVCASPSEWLHVELKVGHREIEMVIILQVNL